MDLSEGCTLLKGTIQKYLTISVHLVGEALQERWPLVGGASQERWPLVGEALQERELLYMFYIEICSTDVRDRPFNLKGGVWFFVSFRIFFSDNTRVRIFFFVAKFVSRI